MVYAMVTAQKIKKGSYGQVGTVVTMRQLLEFPILASRTTYHENFWCICIVFLNGICNLTQSKIGILAKCTMCFIYNNCIIMSSNSWIWSFFIK